MKQPREEIRPAPGPTGGSERFSGDEQLLMRREFAGRLKTAFDNANNAEIARRLRTSDATIKFYVDGVRLPVYEMLYEIARVTGINLHWLITGNGEKRVTKVVEMFSDEEEAEIRRLAVAAGRSFEDEVKILAMAAADLVTKA